MRDLLKICSDVREWVKEVGELQREHWGQKDLLLDTKSTEVDLVTNIDKLSESILLEKIHTRFPDDEILSEETGRHQGTSNYLWVIDPLDGTTNYAQGLPIFSVSVAMDFRKETLLGIVYCPVTDQLFEAVKGKGAFLNGRPIHVGGKTRLVESLLATGFPYDQATHPDNNANYFAHMVPKARGLRRLGSAAYDLASVAAGFMDGFWEINLRQWDVAAGILIVEEAGGKVIFLPKKRGVSLVAGNETVCQLILHELDMVDKTV